MTSALRGVNHLRRTLKRLDPEITQELRDAVRSGAELIEAAAQAFVPVDEGDLRRSISHKLGSDKLTAIIGPAAKQVAKVGGRTSAGAAFSSRAQQKLRAKKSGRISARNKKALFQFFKGYWLEYGTKGSPEHNIPPLRARPFMRPAFARNESVIVRNVRQGVTKALERAGRG